MAFVIRVVNGNKPDTTANVSISGKGWLDGTYGLTHTGDGWYSTNGYSKSEATVYVNKSSFGLRNNGTTIKIG